MPGEAKYYIGLGQALDYKGKPKEAEAAYRTALDLDSDLREAHERLAHNLYAHGRYDEAIKTWNELVARDPNNAEAHNRLSLAYYYTGQYAESWRHLLKAEQLGYAMPPQFRPLLAQQMSEPGGG
jgi:tetratricopeptide (TPR) repeat protein